LIAAVSRRALVVSRAIAITREPLVDTVSHAAVPAMRGKIRVMVPPQANVINSAGTTAKRARKSNRRRRKPS
jgi:hypothetical protein